MATKCIFVINPAAGQGEAANLKDDIRALCEAAGLAYEIHETTGPGKGETFVRTRCKAFSWEKFDSLASDEILRFYACGGDGTLNEVVNGAIGYDFAEVGCIPVGTGNDFVRNFPAADFSNLADQIRGRAQPCDLIRYEGICDGVPTSRYCVNMCNIGFDSNVVDLTARMKRLPFMSGTLAYLTSVATMLIERKGADLRVEYPGGSDSAPGYVYDGKLLLIAIANGAFCGSGMQGVPRATTDDGLMDVSLVRYVPRRTFVRLFPKYMKGTHLSEPRLKDVIRYSKERQLLISPNHDTMKFCVDGEIAKAGQVRFAICPGVFRFVVPKKAIETEA